MEEIEMVEIEMEEMEKLETMGIVREEIDILVIVVEIVTQGTKQENNGKS